MKLYDDQSYRFEKIWWWVNRCWQSRQNLHFWVNYLFNWLSRALSCSRKPELGQMSLFNLTATMASVRVKFSYIMRNARTKAPERLTPIAQWTSTFPAAHKEPPNLFCISDIGYDLHILLIKTTALPADFGLLHLFLCSASFNFNTI